MRQQQTLGHLAVYQLIFSVISSGVWVWVGTPKAGVSAFLGGLIATIGTAYLFAKSRPKKHLNTKTALASFYWVEGVKVLLTLVLMSFCIVVLKVAMLPFIIAYLITALIMNWLFLGIMSVNNTSK